MSVYSKFLNEEESNSTFNTEGFETLCDRLIEDVFESLTYRAGAIEQGYDDVDVGNVYEVSEKAINYINSNKDKIKTAQNLKKFLKDIDNLWNTIDLEPEFTAENPFRGYIHLIYDSEMDHYDKLMSELAAMVRKDSDNLVKRIKDDNGIKIVSKFRESYIGLNIYKEITENNELPTISFLEGLVKTPETISKISNSNKLKNLYNEVRQYLDDNNDRGASKTVLSFVREYVGDGPFDSDINSFLRNVREVIVKAADDYDSYSEFHNKVANKLKYVSDRAGDRLDDRIHILKKIFGDDAFINKINTFLSKVNTAELMDFSYKIGIMYYDPSDRSSITYKFSPSDKKIAKVLSNMGIISDNTLNAILEIKEF